ncbi:MAG: TerD family protein [Armatimonadetes bacterium]|nr:TerD family protein [Armatimonadota bacterium]
MRQFLRGERHKLADFAPLHRVWQVELSLDAPQFVIDYCCLGLDIDGHPVGDEYLIFYNRPDAPYGAISLDNASNNGALFTLDLGNLPASVRRLVFTATLHRVESEAAMINVQGNGALADIFASAFGLTPDIGEGYLSLGAGTRETEIIEAGFFAFSGADFGRETTLVIGEIGWKDEWRFIGVGKGLAGDLSAFLRHLDGGSVRAQPVTIPPARVLSPATPTLAPPAPRRTPLAAPSPPAVVPTVAKPVAAAPIAQSPPPGGTLQDLIDAAAPNSTLTLMRGEYQGPFSISKPLTLRGQNSALWARQGPVVTVESRGVALHDLEIEVTIPQNASGESDIALKIVGEAPQLHDVRVRGRITGLLDGEGEWILPPALDLGRFAARAENGWKFELRVPTAVQLSSSVEGLSPSPDHVEAGQHQIMLTLRDVVPDAIIAGQIEVRSASLSRTIPVSGSAAKDLDAARAMPLWRLPAAS